MLYLQRSGDWAQQNMELPNGEETNVHCNFIEIGLS